MRVVRHVYLDHNATTPLRAEARERWLEVSDELGGNPSSLHARGRRARQRVDEAREQVAAALSCHEEEVIFTSGGTESNNMALWGVLGASNRAGGLVTTGIEHSSVLEPAAALNGRGVPLELLPVDAQGLPRVDELEGVVRRAAPALVSIAAANNEIGSVAPLAQIARALEEVALERPLLHTDAAQALGKIPLDLHAWGVDLASLSAHKIGGPLGTGVLWRRHGLRLEPLLRGGSQEAELRAGTENVAGIAAAALAFELAVREQAEYASRVSTLCHDLWRKLADSSHALRLVGPPIGSAHRLPNTLCVLVGDTDGKVLVTQLDLEGLEVGAGSACASGSLQASHVLLCMGLDEDRARSAIRLSMGRESTWEDCAQAVDILEKVLRRSGTT